MDRHNMLQEKAKLWIKSQHDLSTLQKRTKYHDIYQSYAACPGMPASTRGVCSECQCSSGQWTTSNEPQPYGTQQREWLQPASSSNFYQILKWGPHEHTPRHH